MNFIEKQKLLEKAMQAIAGAVEDTFNETVGPMGYALIVFELGRPGIGNYISNAQRSDMIKALRETACMACHKSYCACCVIQLSALPPNALETLIAISGDIPKRPSMRAERVFLDTPSPSAASVMVNPNGSIQRFFNALPGCGGLWGLFRYVGNIHRS